MRIEIVFFSHTEFLHLSILNECYNPEAVHALTVVRNLIDQESNEASHQLQHVKQGLSCIHSIS